MSFCQKWCSTIVTLGIWIELSEKPLNAEADQIVEKLWGNKKDPQHRIVESLFIIVFEGRWLNHQQSLKALGEHSTVSK